MWASWILPLLLLVLPGPAQAQFYYTTDPYLGLVIITAYYGPGGAVAIPSTINGLPVTGIGPGAFQQHTNVTSVTIPSSVVSIVDGAFGWCTNLRLITVDGLNPVYSSRDGVLFDKSQTTLVEYPGGKATTYTVPNSVTSIGLQAFVGCTGLTSVTIGNSVATIWKGAFVGCTSLTNVTIPNSVTNIGDSAFAGCSSLTSVTIGNSVTSIASQAFEVCTRLTNVIIGSSVTNIGSVAFWGCTSLTSVTIGNSVTNIGYQAFSGCSNLAGVYFMGNAPSPWSGFDPGSGAIVYYLPGTTGWGSTFGGRPTAPWPPPTIQTSPQTQTAEAGSAVAFQVTADGALLSYQWFFNGTNSLGCTRRVLELPDVQSPQAGTYTVVVTNPAGSVTSAPTTLSVVPVVDRRPVPALSLIGDVGSALHVEQSGLLGSPTDWLPLDTVNLIHPPQYWFDVSTPLPPQRFYRAWQTGTPAVLPSLNLKVVPALTLTGGIGNRLRVDYINQFGPTDAWVTLAMVTLTNTSQLYFDTSAIGQPTRLYRIVPLP